MVTYLYEPDYIAPPGETLLEALEERQMSQTQLAQRLGKSRKFVNEIVRGKARISEETAIDLEQVFSIPAQFWLNLEQQYRIHLARSEQQQKLAEQIGWLKHFPLNEMVKRGWIARVAEPIEQLRQLLAFFGMAYPAQWEVYWAEAQHAFRFATAYQHQVNSYALAAWLRQGERQAQDVVCAAFGMQRFKEALKDLRAATSLPPEEYYALLSERCASVGVAVVYVEELPKTHICGATYWLSPIKAVIQLSSRYKASDHLWFTFYHEAGHIVLHSKTETYIDIEGQTNDKEAEADEFARDILIPSVEWKKFVYEHGPMTKARIVAFAAAHGIGADIVAGRLKHEQRLRFTNHQDLRVPLPPLPLEGQTEDEN